MDLFEVFVRSHQDMVFSTALRIVGNKADAEDIAQIVFIQAHKHFEKLGADPSAGSWLRTAARNFSINHYNRYQNRWRFFSSFDSFEDDPYEPVQPETETGWLFENGEALRQALIELPSRFRAPLVLYHYEDLSYEEIAAMLKISAAKVKSDIFRGREALRKKLQLLELHHE